MSEKFNPYDGTDGNGYQPNSPTDSVVMPPPKHGSNARKTPEFKRFVPMPPVKPPREENLTLEELAKEIAERGNDMQTTHSKDGLKVFEVSKKLVKVIRS